MRIIAAIAALFALAGCTRERTSVYVFPTGHPENSKAVRLEQDGAVIAYPMTFVKGKYNVLEWPACRKIQSVKIHDDGSGLPEVAVEYSNKDCGL